MMLNDQSGRKRSMHATTKLHENDQNKFDPSKASMREATLTSQHHIKGEKKREPVSSVIQYRTC